jgi:hypothetical protein
LRRRRAGQTHLPAQPRDLGVPRGRVHRHRPNHSAGCALRRLRFQQLHTHYLRQTGCPDARRHDRFQFRRAAVAAPTLAWQFTQLVNSPVNFASTRSGWWISLRQ